MKILFFFFLLIPFFIWASIKCPHCGYENQNPEDTLCLECASVIKEASVRDKKTMDENKDKISYQGKFYSQEEYKNMMKEKKSKLEKSKPKQQTNVVKISVICSDGEAVSLKDAAVSGAVTVFDFYADWCGPCKALTPKLEQLVNEMPDVYLRKINIVNWKSPVTKQYEIDSIPSVWIYDKKGVLLKKKINGFDTIKSSIQSALKD